jgi:hypothetical protein
MLHAFLGRSNTVLFRKELSEIRSSEPLAFAKLTQSGVPGYESFPLSVGPVVDRALPTIGSPQSTIIRLGGRSCVYSSVPYKLRERGVTKGILPTSTHLHHINGILRIQHNPPPSSIFGALELILRSISLHFQDGA